VLLVIVAVAVTIATKGALTKFAAGALKGALGLGAAAVKATAALAPVIGGALAGAAGSIASQGFGVATGLQDRFSWTGVAMAGISGGVGGGLGGAAGGGFVGGAIGGIAGNAMTQGIAVATGLQKKFDWAGLAVAGVVGGVAGALGDKLKLKPLVGEGANTSVANHLRHGVTSMAAGIAGAASRSVLTGTSFGDNLLRVLPDVIGSTIGNMVGHGVSSNAPRLAYDPGAFGGRDGLSGGLGGAGGTAMAAPGMTNAVAAGPVAGVNGGKIGGEPNGSAGQGVVSSDDEIVVTARRRVRAGIDLVTQPRHYTNVRTLDADWVRVTELNREQIAKTGKPYRNYSEVNANFVAKHSELANADERGNAEFAQQLSDFGGAYVDVAGMIVPGVGMADTAYDYAAGSITASQAASGFLPGRVSAMGRAGERAGARIIEAVDATSLVRSHSIGGRSSTARVDRIATSMRSNGYVGDPIQVIQSDGRMIIVDGHHRTVAASRTGTPVNIQVVGSESFPMGSGGWQSIDEVIQASQTAGPNRLNRPRK
ncbi:MAG TPA: ParB/RepB/Spo0J family partition protein, partial [Sphingomonadaceae bacterium]|nr:ParB/RepB/Spo0J family partition protein [Sphingomonadaceae bacterium]